MAGEIKINDVSIATESGGTVTLGNATLGSTVVLGTNASPIASNLVLAAGNGIDFSAASGSAAGSSSAVLDDYEEGTWTPQLYADTVTWSPSTRYGHYVKIGNLVTVQFYILETAISGTTSNPAKIINLPFASPNLSPYAQYGNSIWTSATASISALKTNNDSTITMWQTGTGTTTVTTASTVSNRYLVGSISYYTV